MGLRKGLFLRSHFLLPLSGRIDHGGRRRVPLRSVEPG